VYVDEKEIKWITGLTHSFGKVLFLSSFFLLLSYFVEKNLSDGRDSFTRRASPEKNAAGNKILSIDLWKNRKKLEEYINRRVVKLSTFKNVSHVSRL